MIQNQQVVKLKVLRTHNQFNMYKKKLIKMHKIVVSVPQQNGLVEKMNKTILKGKMYIIRIWIV